MIRAQRLTVHGKTKDDNIEVQFYGDMGDIMLELAEMLNSLETMIDNNAEDIEEKYQMLRAIRDVTGKTKAWLDYRKTMHMMKVPEEEIYRVKSAVMKGMDVGTAFEMYTEMGKKQAARKSAEAGKQEEALAEAIGGEEKKDE